MNQTGKYLKLYKIAIDATRNKSGRWYTDKNGEEFYCLLATKEAGDSMIVPVYYVVGFDGKRIQPQLTALTIRPEDCKIVEEQNFRATSCIEAFYRHICRYGNAA